MNLKEDKKTLTADEILKMFFDGTSGETIIVTTPKELKELARKMIEIKKIKPNLVIGQKLWACLGFDNNKIQHYEVAEGTNKKSLRIKCFDDDSTPWFSTGFG